MLCDWPWWFGAIVLTRLKWLFLGSIPAGYITNEPNTEAVEQSRLLSQ